MPDSLQDIILARLLAQNQQQAHEQGVLLEPSGFEAPTAPEAEAKPKKAPAKPKGKDKQQKSVIDLPLFQ